MRIEPEVLRRTYSEPLALAGLAVDLIPVYAVLVLGWDAAALVFLYWLENLVIGALTLARMTAVAAGKGAASLAGMVFVGPFFAFHYGLFCFVHGQFLNSFADLSEQTAAGFPGPLDLVAGALAAGPGMAALLGIIIAWQAWAFIADFIGRGSYRKGNVAEEMSGPYGRIILLHIALFAGFAALLALGQPMLGVLGLIALRTLYGVAMAVRRRLRLEREVGQIDALPELGET